MHAADKHVGVQPVRQRGNNWAVSQQNGCCEQYSVLPAMVQAERAKYAEKLGRLKVDDIHQLLDLMDIVPRGSGSKVPFSFLHKSVALLPR